MKIVERKCPVGKWRFTFREIHGHTLEGIDLKGMRRPVPLSKVPKDEFLARVPLDQHGNINAAATTLWAVPTQYMQDGLNVYIWPAPAHEWILQLHLNRKEHVASAVASAG